MRLTSHFYRVPLSVPYWNGATYQNIIRSFASGTIIEGPDLSKLRSLVIGTLGVEAAVLCGSGSLALEIALRACEVQRGDEVIIPTFCCTAIVPPVLAIGALPVLADVGEELNITPAIVEELLTKKTKVIIVPHLFGNPADIRTIIELTYDRNIRVIDDAAQALGATVDGQSVGSFGDAGILSFGSEKVCFGLGGGVVASRKKDFFNRNSKIELARPQLSSTLRNFFSTAIWRRWRRWMNPLQALSRAKATGPDSLPIPYRPEFMANLKAAVALSLMQNLGENIAARRARGRAYQELLGTEERLELIPHQSGSACLTQVVRILPKHRGDLAAHLIRVLGSAGYEVQGSYVPIHLLSDYQRWARKPLLHAERVWDDLIELPCEPDMSFDDLERIVTIVKQVVNS
jgi:dTDP-4-amino-4,6-dideoxygalactose transaminase